MSDASPPGRRERKKMLTYQAIHAAALRLAVERGVDAVTIDDICDEADIARRTFSNYFESKDDAFLGYEAGNADHLAQTIASWPPSESPLELLRMVLRERALELMEGPPDGELPPRLGLIRDNPQLLQRQLARFAAIEDTIAKALAQRLPPGPVTELRAALLAALAGTVMRVAVRQSSAGDRPIGDVIEDALDLIAEGL